MIRIFFRHVWDSLKNLRRNGWMTVAAVSSVTITLVLVGIFLSFILNAQKLVQGLENNVRITVYMKLDVHDQSKTIANPSNAAQQIANPDYQKVKKVIEKIPDVKGVTFSSKQEQLDQLTHSLGKVWNLYQGDANPLYDAYIVNATDPKYVKTVSADIKKISGVQDVNYGGTNTNKIFALANMVTTWGSVGAILLVILAVFLISNTIRITIISRSREIQIMRLVGAKNSYIRWPFFLEGAWVGLLGAIIPSCLIDFLYGAVYGGVQTQLDSQGLSMYSPGFFVPTMTILLFAIGIIIGSFGSVLSMRRYLKA